MTTKLWSASGQVYEVESAGHAAAVASTRNAVYTARAILTVIGGRRAPTDAELNNWAQAEGEHWLVTKDLTARQATAHERLSLEEVL